MCPYRLLALTCAMKTHRCNSMLYSHDKNYKIAEEIKMSPQVFKKYIKWAKEEGILIATGKHWQFINLDKAVQKLFPSINKWSTKYITFFANFKKKRSYKHYIGQIEYAFTDLNYKQQEHAIQANKSILSILNSPKLSIKDYRKALKRFHVSDLKKLEKCLRNSKKDVVSGKYHVAKILNCSPSKAAKLLRKWALEERFKREIHNCFVNAFVCNESFDELKKQGYKNIGVGKDGYYLNLGSALSEFNR